MTKTRSPHGATPADACRTAASIGLQLDAELDQSFPASDPPSILRDPPAPICDEAQVPSPLPGAPDPAPSAGVGDHPTRRADAGRAGGRDHHQVRE
ncbi:hypothetical protein [Xanthobacter agilis]|uniref:hypothetical protein n=1 Tax=Xanthobacter agilis TaxID=47492 RepID=UPI00372C7F4D